MSLYTSGLEQQLLSALTRDKWLTYIYIYISIYIHTHTHIYIHIHTRIPNDMSLYTSGFEQQLLSALARDKWFASKTQVYTCVSEAIICVLLIEV